MVEIIKITKKHWQNEFNQEYNSSKAAVINHQRKPRENIKQAIQRFRQ